MKVRLKIFYLVKIVVSLLLFANCLEVQSSALGFYSKGNFRTPVMNTSDLSFVENKGQVEDTQGGNKVLFYGNVGSSRVYLKSRGFSYVLHHIESSEEEKEAYGEDQGTQTEEPKVYTHRVDVDFVGCDLNAKVISSDAKGGHFNYYYSHCSGGITNVKQYTTVDYKGLYEGVDLHVLGKENGFEYDFVVEPGGHASDIRMHYSGANEVKLERGKLVVYTGIGRIEEFIPRAYQINENGIFELIKAEYVLEHTNTGYQVSFALGKYDPKKQLIIDPWVSYYGGSSTEQGYDITSDNTGNIVATGWTNSPDLPILGAFQATHSGGSDAFVVKLSPTGSLLWATYYGGSAGLDWAFGIATDPSENVMITGFTNSSNFPVSNSCFQSNLKGAGDAFLVNLDPNGLRNWATYCGGMGAENNFGKAVTADGSGNIYMTGDTQSTDFPVQNAIQPNIVSIGAQDGYLIKFDPFGAMLWSTYFGANGQDWPTEVATDSQDNVIMAGTASPGLLVTNAYQSAIAGGRDAFVAKFTSSGSLLWSTYYGGSSGGDEQRYIGMAIDNADNVIISGTTAANDFPVSAGCYQSLYGGGFFDSYIVKFDPSGGRLWSTYLGGAAQEEGLAVAVGSNNNIFVSGDTYSSDFPITACAFQSILSGKEDIYVSEFDSDCNLICATFVGGDHISGGVSQDDEMHHGSNPITVTNDLPYVIAYASGSIPVTSGAFQTAITGSAQDAFIAQVGCEQVLTVGSGDTLICNGESTTLTSLNPDVMWSPSYGLSSTLGNSISANPSTTTIYMATSSCSLDTLYTTVHVFPNPVLSLSPDQSICLGDILTLSASSASGGATSYTWKPSVGLSSTTGTSVNASPSINTNYLVTASGSNGCNTTALVGVSVITITVTASNDVTITEGESVVISANGAYSYQWTLPDYMFCDTCSNTSVYPLLTTMYTVTGTDAFGCVDDDSVRVVVIPIKVMYIPNSLTPNNDGLNDVFMPVLVDASNITSYIMYIFDRWGNELFSTTDVAQGWDGRDKSGKYYVQQDVYLYMIKISDRNKVDLPSFIGRVSVVR